MYFGSDNQTGASDTVLAALTAANNGVTSAYANDEYTLAAEAKLKAFFDYDADIFFVSTGTAANSLALACMAKRWDSILCHGQAHIINDELTAPEFFTQGARLVGINEREMKLSAELVADYLSRCASHPPHNSELTVLSISQVSEAGQVYSVEEIKALCKVAHDNGLSVHMDGARFANALVSLDCHPADITWKAGVDVLCLGATKNGALAAEAVVFFNKDLSKEFIQHRKRSGHLISKSRFLGAQFLGWLEDDNWHKLASQANQMAQRLALGLEASKHCQIIWPSNANEIFLILSLEKADLLRKAGAVFSDWPKRLLPEPNAVKTNEGFYRFVTSFRTTPEQVDEFLHCLDSD